MLTEGTQAQFQMDLTIAATCLEGAREVYMGGLSGRSSEGRSRPVVAESQQLGRTRAPGVPGQARRASARSVRVQEASSVSQSCSSPILPSPHQIHLRACRLASVVVIFFLPVLNFHLTPSPSLRHLSRGKRRCKSSQRPSTPHPPNTVVP